MCVCVRMYGRWMSHIRRGPSLMRSGDAVSAIHQQESKVSVPGFQTMVQSHSHFRRGGHQSVKIPTSQCQVGNVDDRRDEIRVI